MRKQTKRQRKREVENYSPLAIPRESHNYVRTLVCIPSRGAITLKQSFPLARVSKSGAESLSSTRNTSGLKEQIRFNRPIATRLLGIPTIRKAGVQLCQQNEKERYKERKRLNRFSTPRVRNSTECRNHRETGFFVIRCSILTPVYVSTIAFYRAWMTKIIAFPLINVDIFHEIQLTSLALPAINMTIKYYLLFPFKINNR